MTYYRLVLTQMLGLAVPAEVGNNPTPLTQRESIFRTVLNAVAKTPKVNSQVVSGSYESTS